MRKLLRKYKEIIAYLFWGVMTTIVSWGSYTLLVTAFSFEKQLCLFGFSFSLNITLANVLSWIIAVLFAFFMNKIFVFESRSWKKAVFWPELGKFISARIATGIIEIIAVPALAGLGLDYEILGIEGSLSKIIVSIVVVILNYVFSKIFVFKNKKKERSA